MLPPSDTSVTSSRPRRASFVASCWERGSRSHMCERSWASLSASGCAIHSCLARARSRAVSCVCPSPVYPLLITHHHQLHGRDVLRREPGHLQSLAQLPCEGGHLHSIPSLAHPACKQTRVLVRPMTVCVSMSACLCMHACTHAPLPACMVSRTPPSRACAPVHVSECACACACACACKDHACQPLTSAASKTGGLAPRRSWRWLSAVFGAPFMTPFGLPWARSPAVLWRSSPCRDGAI